MHFRKSIFYKSIIFVMSVLAMAIFSFTKINAESCEVVFNDQSQYLTIGGDVKSWQDKGIKRSDDCSSWTELTTTSLTVNGAPINEKQFTTENRASGHYTVGYNYSYMDGGQKKTGVIYRYVRILNSSFDTSNNFTLGTFEFDDNSDANVIESFYIGNNYFSNFVVHGNKTFIVTKDALGRTIEGDYGVFEVKHGTLSVIAASVVENDGKYYVIGNNQEGNGVLLIYSIGIDTGNVVIGSDSAHTLGDNKVYNDGFVYVNGENISVYMVGKNSNGYPIIDSYVSSTITNIYTYTTIKGAYNGVIVVNGTVYAVGYTKSDASYLSTGLYTYKEGANDAAPAQTILSESANTVFYDIIYDAGSNQNIIIGESDINQIYANGTIVDTNKRQGYTDGIILRVSLDGQSITAARMLGAGGNDKLTSIKLINTNSYTVIGSIDDGVTNVVYSVDKSTFEVEEEIASSTYKINGIVTWDNGYAYYGKIITATSILGVYNTQVVGEKHDALFIVLDNRIYKDYETENIVVDTIAKYCDYLLDYGLNPDEDPTTGYKSEQCKKALDNPSDETLAKIETSTTGQSIMEYIISSDSGVIIYVYRVVNINSAPVATNLNNSYTGILRWYVYNRSYTYINDNSVRYDTTDFNYKFNGDVHGDETIEDMIEYYLENGNTNGYSLSYVTSLTGEYKTFTNSKQTRAAFASIEYAKKFAYYQEFSRVIRMDGSVYFDKLGANAYYNQVIAEGRPYYIYYIDYKGNTTNTDVGSCRVSVSSIGNCTAKGGYAFSSLDAIKNVIELFLNYNNYFVSTRNTIYNGSVDPSEIAAYKQDLDTTEYLKSVKFENVGTNLTFNIAKEDGSEVYYSGTGKNVYFGGELKNGRYSHPLLDTTQEVSQYESNGVVYYANAKYVFFPENMCYKVYYTYVDANDNVKSTGTARSFCLDTKAPIIEYKKDNSTTTNVHTESDAYGTLSNPLEIEKPFQIVNLIDLDDYAFIYVSGNRYPITCDDSKSCEENVTKYIKQRFEYNQKNPNSPVLIEFSDRLGNSVKFYFVIGTNAPTIDTTNESNTGFTLVIDFYKTNPIKGVSLDVYQQKCTGEASQGCYTPNTSDENIKKEENAITVYTAEFIEALANYIYAVGYRDNNSEVKEVIEIEAKDGIYKFLNPLTEKEISYKVIDGYFTEIDGYQESYAVDVDNTFYYGPNEKRYKYDNISNSIQALVEEDGEYVSDGSDSITLVNNIFKFSEDGKEYTVVTSDEGTFIEVLPQKYEIKNNEFEIGKLNFTIDSKKEIISYNNPVVDGMKHIEINFERTIENTDGSLSGGVDIPLTKEVEDIEVDPYTNLPAREIVEEKFIHFNLVDGIYNFMISQDFQPYAIVKETKINVPELDLKIGYSQDYPGLQVINRPIHYEDEGEAPQNSLVLKKINNEFSYPLGVEGAPNESGLGNYSDIQFIDRTVYTTFTTGINGVFSVNIYRQKNEYGLPINAVTCEQIVIYADSYEDNPLQSEGQCNTVYAKSIAQIDTEFLNLLATYEIYQVVTDSTSFAFKGQNILYEISLQAFVKNESGIYIPSAMTATRRFFIDTLAPNYNDGVNGPTIDDYVYDDNGLTQTENTNVSFTEETTNVFVLSQPVGDITNISFNINWNQGSALTDYRENKLLLISISTSEESATCNLYRSLSSITDPHSIDECVKYVDVNNSNTSKIVFSTTGDYQVTFKDSSGNSVVYKFVIDKAAPTLELNRVIVNKNGEDTLVSYDVQKGIYYVLDYAKNPTTVLSIGDLTAVTKYCYYFLYNGVKYDQDCVLSSQNEIVIDMSSSLITQLNGIDELVSLYVWGVDALENDGEDNPTIVHFWVDYKKPTLSFTTTNMNTTTIDIGADTTLYTKTISIISGEYSNSDVTCSDTGFSFVDNRYTTTGAPYTFVVNCSDMHSHEGDDFPENYSKEPNYFKNTMIMKFYEYDKDTSTKGTMFNFSKPTNPGEARWIYITAIDSVGNESEDYIVVPIMVHDDVEPEVVKAEKVLNDSTTEVINSTVYAYPGAQGAIKGVYLANGKVRITFSEPIAKMLKCLIRIGNIESYEEKDCSDEDYGDGYNQGDMYAYESKTTAFEFDLTEENKYKVIIFQVADFAGWPSEEIVVVIDKIAPEISFDEDGGEDKTIEYITGNTVYGENYTNSGHLDDVVKSDDQNTEVKVTINYYIYRPLVTYKNYIYTYDIVSAKYIYKPINDGEIRQVNTKYYLMLRSDLVENKRCIATTFENNQKYCFVEDTQAFYYFDSKLEESSDFWSEVSQIDSSKIGVYRISYYATDYAGNVSETIIYKKVFVNDTINPDIDLYETSEVNDASASALYRNVAGENTDNFEGKLNRAIAFKGKDSAVDANTRIILYRCAVDTYEAGTCNIDQSLFSDDTVIGKGESSSNIYSLGNKLNGGVYKVFVYDIGQYLLLADDGVRYSDSDVQGEKIYSLTHNDSSFYFAIVNTSIDAYYVINGNKYTSDYGSGLISYNKSDINYYTITNGSAASDVILKLYDYNRGQYVDVSGINAIGYEGAQLGWTDNGDVIVVQYKDAQNRVIYQVTYQKYPVSSGLYLSRTYHRIDSENKIIEVCKYIHGKNQCEDEEYVYQVTGVIANVYKDGNYTLKMVDRYGNYSQDVEEFVVDNTPYLVNKNNNLATGINYWYSVPSEVINSNNLGYFNRLKGLDNSQSINVLDSVYNDNFNSSFFYAFASRDDAKAYLEKLYSLDIDSKGTSNYSYYTVDGQQIVSQSNDKDKILKEINIDQLIFSIYTQSRNFSDSNVKQIAYTGSSLSSNMYKYAYLLVTENVNARGEVSYSYEYKGDSCQENASNEKCVQVDLKIINAGSPIDLEYNSNINNLICRVSGVASVGGSLTGEGCDFARATSGATYIFIDSDVNKYHVNTVYYGITAYTESTNVDFNEVGTYIPLEKFIRYDKELTGSNQEEYNESPTGDYLWLNSKWVSLRSIKNTNLYVKSCEFNGDNYQECIFTSYFSGYNHGTDGVLIPSDSIEVDGYYDYSDGKIYSKQEIIEKYGISFSYSLEGIKNNDTTGQYLPVVTNVSSVNATVGGESVVRTNKKAYIKLFDSSTTKKIFEVNAIMVNGKYTEVYSYAYVTVNGNPLNLNDGRYIKISKDGTSYECIIDLDLESEIVIIVIDRAGNSIRLTFSHSSITPDIIYAKESESSSSNVTIDLTTASNVANINKANVKTYKHNGTEFVEIMDNTCIAYLQNVGNNEFVKNLTLQYKYNLYTACSGVYRVSVSDTHGNTNYKDFVFNPYDLNTSYDISGSDKYYEYEENDINGLIVSDMFGISVDASLNYIVITKYDSYSNLDLKNPEIITIKDFTTNHSFANNACVVNIARSEGTIYSVKIGNASNHACDGIYTIDIINRFSEDILDSEFKDLEGVEEEVATYRVVYGASSTIELDTTAPKSDLIDNVPYFSVLVDEVENQIDTENILEIKTLYYTNKYITIVWGGHQEHSLAYLRYKIDDTGNEIDEEWNYYSEGVTYDKDYNASYLFKITTPGIYICEFMFEDAVGNHNVEKTYKLIITIEAPKVALYEVDDDPNVVGRQYEYGERIADRTILKCLTVQGAGFLIEPCELKQYDYKMVINNEDYPAFSLDKLDLQGIISRNSWWLLNTEAQYAEELVIQLTVSIVGKPEIKTDLSVVIDKKAPVINFEGVTVGTTYIGSVIINISNEDSSNEAKIYSCDAIVAEECKVYNSNKELVNGNRLVGIIESGSDTFIVPNSKSGYFMVVANDDLGNISSNWFVLDNEDPSISITTDNTIVAPNMYTNAKAVFVTVNDKLSQIGSKFNIEFTPVNEGDETEIKYDSLVGLTKEGKYVLTPIDGVNREGRSVTFYIYRQAPKYTLTTDNEDDGNVVNSQVSLSWKREENILVAPIISVTMDGKMYPATYDSSKKQYVGETVTTIGEHTFVLTDAAGNRSVIMVTINNTNKVCINGKSIEVKMQAYYNIDSLLIGMEKGITYQKDDVVIFALPSQVSSGECVSQGLLGYRTLDPENSNYLINNDRNAELFNTNKYDFVKYGFISQSAIDEVKNVGGTVVVFVVTKDIANKDLGYKVGTNFFMEDPIGWSMIFIATLSLVWPAIRVFVKKKVRVI